MTEKQALKIGSRWKELLGLDHWGVRLSTTDATHLNLVGDEEEGECGASITFDDRALSAQIRLALDCDDETADERLCHEMIHLVLAPYARVLYQAGIQLSPQAREIIYEMGRDANEQATVALTRALIELKREGKQE